MERSTISGILATCSGIICILWVFLYIINFEDILKEAIIIYVILSFYPIIGGLQAFFRFKLRDIKYNREYSAKPILISGSIVLLILGLLMVAIKLPLIGLITSSYIFAAILCFFAGLLYDD